MKGRLVVDHANHITEYMGALAYEKGWGFDSNPKDSLGQDWNSIHCWLWKGQQFEANFAVQQMPGCCAILVLSYVRVNPWSYGLFDEIVRFVEQAAKDAAFGSVAMTQVVPAYSRMFWKHEPWIKCLDKGRKWVASGPFRNGKSGNLVVYLTKDLEQKVKMEGFETKFMVKETDESTQQGS